MTQTGVTPHTLGRNMHVDAVLPVVGSTLPADHGYLLYGAICREVQVFHEAAWWGLRTVRGDLDGTGGLLLSKNAVFAIRLPADHFVKILPLAGRSLDVGGHGLEVGPPTVHPLVPHERLSARIVTIKGFMEAAAFEQAVQRQVNALPVQASITIGRSVKEVHAIRMPIVPGPSDFEALPRYHRVEATHPWDEVDRCLAAGGKVLWVSNTVGRCLYLAEESTSPALVYHSRFRYCDRVERHGNVVAAFKAPGTVLAISTQVAEMSLDLSADLLVTDLAPIPALIQRLGRLNRVSSPARPRPPGGFLVLEPDQVLPYTADEMAGTRAWLDLLGDGPLSQSRLVEAWDRLPRTEDRVETACSWLDGGMETTPREVREGSPGVTVLLPDDAHAVSQRRERAIRVALPMNAPPRRARLPHMVQGYVVPEAGQISYDPKRGAKWA